MATKIKEPIIARYEICNSGELMFEQSIKRLAYAMKQRNVNTNNLQKDAGLSNGTIYRFFTPDKDGAFQRNTSTSVMMRICMALNVSADWLLFGDGKFRGLTDGEPSLRPEPYDVASDEQTHSDVAPSRSVSSEGVNLPESVLTPESVSAVWSYLNANVTSRHKSSQVAPASARALDDIVLKGANNDVLLALIRQLQSEITALHQQHARDMSLLSEAQTKNASLQSVNNVLRTTITQLSDTLSVTLPKVGDILSPSSDMAAPATVPSGASDDTHSSLASDDSTL